jgi:hypothetical protein
MDLQMISYTAQFVPPWGAHSPQWLSAQSMLLLAVRLSGAPRNDKRTRSPAAFRVVREVVKIDIHCPISHE